MGYLCIITVKVQGPNINKYAIHYQKYVMCVYVFVCVREREIPTDIKLTIPQKGNKKTKRTTTKLHNAALAVTLINAFPPNTPT